MRAYYIILYAWTSVIRGVLSPIGNVITSHGGVFVHTCVWLGYGLEMLAACASAVKQWYLYNNLLLNANNSKIIKFGNVNQLRSAEDVNSVRHWSRFTIRSGDQIAQCILNQRLTFDAHAVVRSCNFCTKAIRHVRPLLALYKLDNYYYLMICLIE